jgi:hypothetical protein
VTTQFYPVNTLCGTSIPRTPIATGAIRLPTIATIAATTQSHDAEFAFQAGQRVGTQAGARSIVVLISSFFRCDLRPDTFFEPL